MNQCLLPDNYAQLANIHLVYLPGDPETTASLLIARNMQNRTVGVLSLDIHRKADDYVATIYEPVFSGMAGNVEQLAAHMLDQALRIVYAAGVRRVRCETLYRKEERKK